MTTNQKRIVTWTAIVLAIGTCLCSLAEAKKPPTPPAGPEYSITPVIPPGLNTKSTHVTDLNDQGCAAVYAQLVDGGYRAIHLDIATSVYTELEGGIGATAINNMNQIAGTVLLDTGDFGLFWASPDAAPVQLPLLPGDVRGWPIALNDAGIAVGISGAAGTPALGVAWQTLVDEFEEVSITGPILLPPFAGDVHSVALDVNETINGSAQIVGYSRDTDGYDRAVLWTLSIQEDGSLTVSPAENLGTLGLRDPSDSQASAVNNWGDVCGSSDRMPCVRWSGETLQELPTIRNTQWATANDINDAGHIVGQLDVYKLKGYIAGPMAYRAYLWKDGEAIDLETLVDDGGWGQLWSGDVINNDGVIAGYGRYDIDHRAFIMTPVAP